jgi:hypothetical protein
MKTYEEPKGPSPNATYPLISPPPRGNEERESAMVTNAPAQPGIQQFVLTARRILAEPVSSRATPSRRVSEDPEVDRGSITADAPVYKAALIMQQRNEPWLHVLDASRTPVGWIDRAALAQVFNVLNASPYLGEELVAQMLPPLDPAELERVRRGE